MSETKRPSVFLTRRKFIQFGAASIGAAWVGTLAQNQLFPSESGVQTANPVEIPLAELPVGGFKQITYAGVPVLVVRTAESIKAFSLICTHLGCTLQWQEGKKEFYCPCHDGRFDRFGEVMAGPPPLPLEQYAIQVDGEKVIIGETA